MTPQANSGFQLLTADLARVEDRIQHLGGLYGQVGFHLVMASEKDRLSPDQWGLIGDRIRWFEFILLASKPRSVEPLPTGAGCILWWGDERAIAEYKRWADDCGAFAARHFLGKQYPLAGYHLAVKWLCEAAPDLPDPKFIKRHPAVPEDPLVPFPVQEFRMSADHQAAFLR